MQTYLRTFVIILIAVVSISASLIAQHSGISMAHTDAGVLYPGSGTLSSGYYTFYRATMSQGVQNTSPYDPINETTNFLPTDSIAVAWSHLINLYKSVRLKAVWIAPNTQTYGTNIGSWSSDPAASGYLSWSWWKFWSWIYIKDFPPAGPAMWGTWTVKLYIEENYTGSWNLESSMTFQITNPTSVQTLDVIPSYFALSQNYPNPFNPTTNISFSLPSRSFVSLKVFDLIGREVATIISEQMLAGNHTKQWNALALPSGVYFYRLSAGSFTETRKLILLR